MNENCLDCLRQERVSAIQAQHRQSYITHFHGHKFEGTQIPWPPAVWANWIPFAHHHVYIVLTVALFDDGDVTLNDEGNDGLVVMVTRRSSRLPGVCG